MGTIVFVFGDSIAWGSWDPEGGWAGRLRTFLMERQIEDESQYFLPYNLGVSGDTTTGVLRRFDGEVAARLREGRHYVFVFAIGINDSVYLNDREPRTAPAEFKKNLLALAGRSKKIARHVVFLGLTPVDETKTAPSEWDATVFYRNTYIQAYNETVKDVATETGAHFLNVEKVFVGQNHADLFDDGLHPNAVGHQRLFEAIRDFLVAEKVI